MYEEGASAASGIALGILYALLYRGISLCQVEKVIRVVEIQNVSNQFC